MECRYSNLGNKELIKLLKERGAKTSGRKHELIERLEAYDRMAAYPSPSTSFLPVPTVNPMPTWPNSSLFKSITPDIQSSLPPVSQDILEQYVLYRSAMDRQANGDIAALKRGELMAEKNIEGNYRDSIKHNLIANIFLSFLTLIPLIN